MKITMIKTDSSNIFSIGFDPKKKILAVRFRDRQNADKGGDTYLYFDVPTDVWVAFKNSESVGEFFHAKIRNGGYKYQKLPLKKGDVAYIENISKKK